MSEKSSRWAFTAYEDQYHLFDNGMPPGVAEWGWNAEICPETKRNHRQGFLRLSQQQRFAWLRKIFPGVHLEVAKDWNKLVNYCKKEETRAPGTVPVRETNDIPTKYVYAEEVAKRLATDYTSEWSMEKILEAVHDVLVTDIISGRRGIEWIGSNPDWKVVWKQFGRAMIMRARNQTDRQTDNCGESVEQNSPADDYVRIGYEETVEETAEERFEKYWSPANIPQEWGDRPGASGRGDSWD